MYSWSLGLIQHCFAWVVDQSFLVSQTTAPQQESPTVHCLAHPQPAQAKPHLSDRFVSCYEQEDFALIF